MYTQAKWQADFFTLWEGEKLIRYSAMHACMHLDVQPKKLAYFFVQAGEKKLTCTSKKTNRRSCVRAPVYVQNWL